MRWNSTVAQTKMHKGMTKVFSGAHALLYKASGGKLGSSMSGGTIGLLTTTGRKSGKERTVPLIVVDNGDGWAVSASYSGHDVHPAWYLNMQAKPEATLTIGKTDHSVRPRVLEGAERKEVWDRLTSAYPDYAEYQKVTGRVIPVVALEKS